MDTVTKELTYDSFGSLLNPIKDLEVDDQILFIRSTKGYVMGFTLYPPEDFCFVLTKATRVRWDIRHPKHISLDDALEYASHIISKGVKVCQESRTSKDHENILLLTHNNKKRIIQICKLCGSDKDEPIIKCPTCSMKGHIDCIKHIQPVDLGVDFCKFCNGRLFY